ncbi:MAG: hypothetical protein MI975_15500, partial [Cytophagales bacterium]|nr:hypothetical protein [Cytophagales bacterium]
MLKRFSRNKEKIFCISFQRTGTTSTGQFFKDHGFKVANWNISRKYGWTESWFKGDYETIFNSKDFKKNIVFEDDPWWLLDFYKVLFHRFPKSKFVLLEREPDKWFDSMVSHSNGKSLGNTHRHAIVYNREEEFYLNNLGIENAYTQEIDNLLPLNEEHRQHYKQIYINRNTEIKLFFKLHDQNRIFLGKLEDPEIWQKMGSFF